MHAREQKRATDPYRVCTPAEEGVRCKLQCATPNLSSCAPLKISAAVAQAIHIAGPVGKAPDEVKKLPHCAIATGIIQYCTCATVLWYVTCNCSRHRFDLLVNKTSTTKYWYQTSSQKYYHHHVVQQIRVQSLNLGWICQAHGWLDATWSTCSTR